MIFLTVEKGCKRVSEAETIGAELTEDDGLG